MTLLSSHNIMAIKALVEDHLHQSVWGKIPM